MSAISETLIVSASQVEIPLSQASSAVSVITGAELRDRQIATVADALRQVPGMAIARAGSAGALTSAFPRGGESDYTIVYVDGVQVNAFGGGFDFAHLSSANIDRIEIVRGPQSALYGSNAVGGVVRIVSRDNGPVRGDASVEGGSFGSTHLVASASGSAANWSWGGGVDRIASDGFNGQHTASGEEIDNDHYDRMEIAGTAGWRGHAGGAIRGELRFGRDDRGFPGPLDRSDRCLLRYRSNIGRHGRPLERVESATPSPQDAESARTARSPGTRLTGSSPARSAWTSERGVSPRVRNPM